MIDLGPGRGRATAGGSSRRARPSRSRRARERPRTARSTSRAALGGARAERAAGARRGRTRDAARSAAVIAVRGAREHNLQARRRGHPARQLVVVTGPSGSGKSTLAFDVVFAEGQRRFLETLTPYARQFLPAAAAAGRRPRDGHAARRRARAAHHARGRELDGRHRHRGRALPAPALRARGAAALPRLRACRSRRAPPTRCAATSRSASASAAASTLLAPRGARRARAPTSSCSRARAAPACTRARIDGALRELDADARRKLDALSRSTTSISCSAARAPAARAARRCSSARSRAGRGTRARARAATTSCCSRAQRACPRCGRGFPELDPRLFSFNTRQGACEQLRGQRRRRARRAAAASARDAACARRATGTRLAPARAAHDARRRAPSRELLALERRAPRVARIARIALHGPRRRARGACRCDEAAARLALPRARRPRLPASTAPPPRLSGGEMQRLRLAAQLGSGLTGALYVLDEPTIGLHPRDTGRLLGTCARSSTQGSTVLVVEHDADTIRAADHLIDLGPGGGRGGGRIVAAGLAGALLARPALAHRPRARARRAAPRRAQAAARRRSGSSSIGAREHNLKDVDLRVPARPLRRGRRRRAARARARWCARCSAARCARRSASRPSAPGAHTTLRGAQRLKRAVAVDQSPDRPHAALGARDVPRHLGRDPQAASRRRPRRGRAASTPSRFSFNVGAGGRCAAAKGRASISVEMSFLPDVLVAVRGLRRPALRAGDARRALHGVHIGEVLELHVDEAREVLRAFPQGARAAASCCATSGLGYLKLGQGSNTLCGGEAQRLKLVAELAQRRRTARRSTCSTSRPPACTSPTSQRLLGVLDRLVDARRHAGRHRAPPRRDPARRLGRRARAPRAARPAAASSPRARPSRSCA